MSERPRLLEVFFDVQRGLPRQGPGSDESTLKALSLCSCLPERPAILDLGCGPGMQTVALAKAVDGSITAVDINPDYLAELSERAKAEGVAERIEILAMDMNHLTVAPASFDVIWSEGAAYIMGFESALAAWKRFLKPGGYIAVTELVWLRPDPPAKAAEFFGNEYPAMADVKTILATMRACLYEPIDHFTLPDRAWWEHYYAPLEVKLPALCGKYRGDEEALTVIKTAQREIEIRRLFPDSYGYEFFVGRTPTTDQ